LEQLIGAYGGENPAKSGLLRSPKISDDSCSNGLFWHFGEKIPSRAGSGDMELSGGHSLGVSLGVHDWVARFFLGGALMKLLFGAEFLVCLSEAGALRGAAGSGIFEHCGVEGPLDITRRW
jgi:hypothetical protein